MKFTIPFLSWAACNAAATETDVSDSKSSAHLALLKSRHFNTKKQMAIKKQKLNAANTLRNFKPSFMQQNVTECDWITEETCYDENGIAVGCESYADGGCPCLTGQEKCNPIPLIGYPGYCIDPDYCCTSEEELCMDADYNPTGCAAFADGGCPCPEGEVKCGGMPEWYIPGYCTEVCCTMEEETCYDDMYQETGCAPLADGGCPCAEGEVKCGAIPEWNYPGWCTEFCCTEEEETCYDETYEESGCAALAEGGCPCPEGQVKCGADPEWDYSGYCTDLCCADDEETCYSSDSFEPESCAPIAEGGCPCAEGEVKCNAVAEIGFLGYCTPLCCEEQTCFDWNTFTPTSCAAWNEECPTGVTFDVLKENAMTMVDQKHQVANYNRIKALKAKLMAEETVDRKDIEKMLQAEELAVLLKAKHTGKSFNKVNEVPVFMTKVF